MLIPNLIKYGLKITKKNQLIFIGVKINIKIQKGFFLLTDKNIINERFKQIL